MAGKLVLRLPFLRFKAVLEESYQRSSEVYRRPLTIKAWILVMTVMEHLYHDPGDFLKTLGPRTSACSAWGDIPR